MINWLDFNSNGFVFYTNYDSKKGSDLLENNYAALNVFWGELERQIRIQGKISKVDDSISDKYLRKEKSPENIAVQLSYPDWIVDRWINQFGKKKALTLCEYFNNPHTLMIRRNELKIDHNYYSPLIVSFKFGGL